MRRLRRLLARLLGLDREVADLRRQLEELRWDKPFGMWTRGAFIQICRVMPRGVRCLVFIDLDGINTLNLRLGYTEVDDRIRSTFSVPFRRSDVVARWYSGDEVVILFDSDRRGADMKIEQLVTAGKGNGLTFESIVGEWKVGQEEIETVIEAISKQVTAEKAKRNRKLPPIEEGGGMLGSGYRPEPQIL